MALINKKLTELTEKLSVPDDAFIHIVDTSDTSQSPEGSSYKAKKSTISGTVKAQSGVSGTVKTNSNSVDPIVYLKDEVDTLIVGKQDSLGFTAENVANKQNNLDADITNAKYPTVTAVNNGLSVKADATALALKADKINTYTKAETDNIIASVEIDVNSLKWIKSNESLSLAQRKGDVIYGILDQYTGEEITLSKVTGTPTVDNIIYFQVGAEYFKRNFTLVNVKWFGAKGDNINDDTLAIQAAIDFCGSFAGTCFVPNGTYKITNGLVINTGILFIGENLTSTVIRIVSATRKVAVKVDSQGTNGYIRGGGIKKFTINCGGTCDGVKIDVVAPYSINQASYGDMKIINTVLGFETKVSDGSPLIYICDFYNIAVEQGIIEGGFKLHGGTYNTHLQLSASDGGVADYYGFDVYQVGSTFTNTTTDSWSTFYNLYGVSTNLVTESTTQRNSLPTRHSVLNIITGIYNRMFFGNCEKNRYTRLIKLNNGETSVKNVDVNNWSSTLQDSLLDISVADGSGIIEGVRTLNPFALKVEDYVSAANLQYYRFLDCESITNLSLKTARVVSALPTPTEKLRYTEVILVLGSGVSDTTYVCIKNKANTYEWVEKTNSKNGKNLTNNTFVNIDANAINGEGKFSAFPILAGGTNLFPTVNNANAILHVDMYEGTAEFAQIGFNAGGDLYHRYSTGAWSRIVKENSSPNFTGTPTAPTATLGTNTTQIATTAFVQANTNSNALLLTGDQTATGVKTFVSTNTVSGGININNNRTSADGRGLYITGSGRIGSEITGDNEQSLRVINSRVSGIATISNTNGSGGFSFYTNLGNNNGVGYYAQQDTGGNSVPFRYNSGGGTITQINVDGTIFAQGAEFNGVVKLKSYTVATLPTGVEGATAYVTDATAPTYLGPLTGGGSVKAPVFFNGTAWVSH